MHARITPINKRPHRQSKASSTYSLWPRAELTRIWTSKHNNSLGCEVGCIVLRILFLHFAIHHAFHHCWQRATLCCPRTSSFASAPRACSTRHGHSMCLFRDMLIQQDMELTSQQSFRSSKMSRLPAPSTQIGGGGLTEWSESQHNARIQSTMTSLASLKNLKREIPQPGTCKIGFPPRSFLLTNMDSITIRSQAQASFRSSPRVPCKADVPCNCPVGDPIQREAPESCRHVRGEYPSVVMINASLYDWQAVASSHHLYCFPCRLFDCLDEHPLQGAFGHVSCRQLQHEVLQCQPRLACAAETGCPKASGF